MKDTAKSDKKPIRKNDLYMRISFGVWFVIATLQADPEGNQTVWVPLWLVSLAILLWFTYQDWKDTKKEKAETQRSEEPQNI
ncbi:MAG: hypothetical protein HQM14_18570 [SAR324 cluster bacterium]|nr:hypothetical protein [SAR324 cluster bacterium]